MRLLFRESTSPGASDGSGPYLDNVVLAKPGPTVAPTPSPTAAPTPSPTFTATAAPTVPPTLPACVTSDANWVCNGSFELNEVPSGSSQDFSDGLVPGWMSLRGTMCLVNNRDGVSAPNGSLYAELDCISGGQIEGVYQDIPTVAGQTYAISFIMRARDPSRASLEDEGVNVSCCSVIFTFLSLF